MLFISAVALASSITAVAALNAQHRVSLQLKKPNSVQLKSNGIKNGSAPSGSKLTYFGGPIIKNVEVHPIWYGNPSFQTETVAFYGGVTASAWFDVMAQYNSGRGTVGKTYSIKNTKSALDDVTDIQAMLKGLVSAGTISPNENTYFPIHFEAGVTISQGGSASCSVFCAYHGTIDISSLNKGVQYLYYGVIPDQGGACAGGCGSDPSTINNMFSVASHELAEMTTDPAVGLATANAAPLAWYDATNGEIGDICNAQQGTTVGGDGATYVVQTIFSNSDNNCVASSSGGSTPPPATTTRKTKTTTVGRTTTTTDAPPPQTTTTDAPIPTTTTDSFPAETTTTDFFDF